MKLFLKFFIIFFFLKSSVFAENYFKINKFSNLSGKSEYEKMEIIFDDYRLYTSRPGAIKIKRISTNELLVLFSDKFKIKFFNDGEDLFDFILDEEKGKIFLKHDERTILHWEGRYIKKHNANFYQILAQGYIPFHFYIKLPGKTSIGLNMESFSARIDKAIAEAKVRIAAKYNISLETIEAILKKQDDKINNELSEIVDEKKEELLELASKKAVEETISSEVDKQVELSIGAAMAKEFDAIIIDGMEDVLAQAVNEAVAEAVSEGISEAAAEAGIRAALEVLARGGSEQDAWDAGCDAAGLARGC
tara:strand:+ start:194 stop:1111 length:918 start_codon:yes stop_codon:yes gene_type:complete